MSTKTKFAPGDVLTYRPDPSKFMPNHCREGIAIVGDDGRALDTFWTGGGDKHALTAVEWKSAELRFRLGEFRKLGESWDHRREEWLTYAPADRRTITSQHGHCCVYYVRNGADPDLDTQIANAREAVAEAERNVESAQRSLEWRREDLEKLEAKAAPASDEEDRRG